MKHGWGKVWSRHATCLNLIVYFVQNYIFMVRSWKKFFEKIGAHGPEYWNLNPWLKPSCKIFAEILTLMSWRFASISGPWLVSWNLESECCGKLLRIGLGARKEWFDGFWCWISINTWHVWMGIIAFKVPMCIYTIRLETISLKIVMKSFGFRVVCRFVIE